jgi:two-component system, NtrC family, response regulator GlrR
MAERVALVGVSDSHAQILSRLERVAGFDAEVLIQGPTGAGKEVYARYLHQVGSRSRGPFVPLNCGAIPAELFENELFGHGEGAFTGARHRTEGLIAAAENGSLFLDEVDSLAMSSQVKLLRFLQNREYRRLGETVVRKANVRIIAATNGNLERQMEQGAFREDLYFRLRVVPIHVPPLCERPEDVEALLAHFGPLYAREYGVPQLHFSPAAASALRTYNWPGNVREVENCIRYLTCLDLGRDVEVCDLPFRPPSEPVVPEQQHASATSLKAAKRELVLRFEREYIEKVLKENEGNITRAAMASGKERRTFFELMRKHGINAAESAMHGNNGGSRKR